ncbi:DUF4279 domain-containing protein [Paraherbaspirillum soli]|uniref:DUF4279 domain-containing protein n=1 Tax=Paraherbaspirillum soli TaxID=631222 RepID=A0ABW0MAK5_9BURK
MHSFHFVVSLRFFSQTIAPSEISVQLGLEPMWQHEIGEPRVSIKGAPLGGIYGSNYCSFRFKRQGSEELNEMLDRIVMNLLQHKIFFDRIREDSGRTEFFIGWYSTGNTGDTFSNSLLSKLGELKIDLALDVYGDGE